VHFLPPFNPVEKCVHLFFLEITILHPPTEKALLASLYHYREAVTRGDEENALNLIISFLENTPWPNCFQRSWIPGHITGSAFVVSLDHKKTLLTHHRKLDAWLQLGGHSDGNTLTWEVALREAQEESGLMEFLWDPNGILHHPHMNVPIPFDVDTHVIPSRGQEPEHIHYDIRYLLFADPDKELVVSSESHSLAWVSFDEIENYSKEPSISRMVAKMAQRGTPLNKYVPLGIH
jgi:8-oxo-dGTP pyrophosphatase MutT (NUDIX family)